MSSLSLQKNEFVSITIKAAGRSFKQIAAERSEESAQRDLLIIFPERSKESAERDVLIL